MPNKNKLRSPNWSWPLAAGIGLVAIFAGEVCYLSGFSAGQQKGEQQVQSKPHGISFGHLEDIINGEREWNNIAPMTESTQEYDVANTQCNKDSETQQPGDAQDYFLTPQKIIVGIGHAVNAEQAYDSLVKNSQNQAALESRQYDTFGLSTCINKAGDFETVVALTKQF